MAAMEAKRVYVGGLPFGVTGTDLRQRFEPFGKVLAVDMLGPDGTGLPRDFAYVTLQTTNEQWKKCVSLYSGSTWRGVKLRLQEAKPTYMQRLEEEWRTKDQTEETEEIKDKIQYDDKQSRNAKHAEDMSPVTDETAKARKGWRLGKHGRAMSLMRFSIRHQPRLRKKGRTMFIFNPSKFISHLRHSFGADYNTPIANLVWHMPEKKPKPSGSQVASSASINEASPIIEKHVDIESIQVDMDRERDMSLKIFEKMFGKTEPLVNNESDAMFDEDHIFLSQNNKKDDSFFDVNLPPEDEVEEPKVSEPIQHSTPLIPTVTAAPVPVPKPKVVAKKPRASPSASVLPTPASSSKVLPPTVNPVSSEAPKATPVDNTSRFAVVQQPLRNLFGTQATESTGFSMASILGKQSENEEQEEEEEEDREKEEVIVLKRRSSSAVSRHHKGQVDYDQEDQEGLASDLSVNPPSMFFFHFDDSKLAGCYSSVADYNQTFFARTLADDNIQKNWENYRTDLTMEFKRKHKSATRRKQKLTTKRRSRK